MTKNHRNLALLSLIGIMTLSPFFSYAKEKDREDEDKKGNRPESQQVERHLCLKAFGHLIAPGYIKNKGRVSFFGDCFLPFGIRKKFNGATSTPADTSAPIISGISVQASSTGAIIKWKTNEKSDGTVFWGLASPVDISSSSTATATENKNTKDHRVVISGLSASTTYYAVIRSRDASGNVGTSSQISFTTQAPASDTTPPVITDVALLLGTSTISVSWKTDENATSRVYYASSTPLDTSASSTTFVENNTLVKNHLISLSGLSASTTYYMALESKDQSGNKTLTPAFTAVTH